MGNLPNDIAKRIVNNWSKWVSNEYRLKGSGSIPSINVAGNAADMKALKKLAGLIAEEIGRIQEAANT